MNGITGADLTADPIMLPIVLGVMAVCAVTLVYLLYAWIKRD